MLQMVQMCSENLRNKLLYLFIYLFICLFISKPDAVIKNVVSVT